MPEVEAPDRWGTRGAGRAVPRVPHGGPMGGKGRGRRRSGGRRSRRRGRRVGRLRGIASVFGLAVLALLALALVTDPGNDSGGGSGGPSGGAGDRASEGSSRQGDATDVPPDIDEPRAPVDLAAVPAGDDPVEVARWWAASYTAYIGSETPDALVDRLASATTNRLLTELAAIPPAASYDPEPADVEGVSNRTPVEERGRVRIRVSVETTGALAVYDLTLVPDEGSGGAGGAGGSSRWLVDEAARI